MTHLACFCTLRLDYVLAASILFFAGSDGLWMAGIFSSCETSATHCCSLITPKCSDIAIDFGESHRNSHFPSIHYHYYSYECSTPRITGQLCLFERIFCLFSLFSFSILFIIISLRDVLHVEMEASGTGPADARGSSLL